MKPGKMVAFILNAQIQFGILAAIIRRESLEGETTQYVVTSIGPDGTANSDQTITNEDDVVDLESWNKGDRLLTLAARTDPYKWAQKKAQELDEPVAPPAPASPEPLVGVGAAAVPMSPEAAAEAAKNF